MRGGVDELGQRLIGRLAFVVHREHWDGRRTQIVAAAQATESATVAMRRTRLVASVRRPVGLATTHQPWFRELSEQSHGGSRLSPLID